MLSSVLKSERAILVNIEIMRTFARLRKYLAAHREIVQRFDEHDARFQVVFDAIRRLMEPSTVSPKRRIGFRPDEGKD
jgi:two-component sensor histidine kinase